MKNLVLIFIFSNLILACRNSAVPGKPEILTAKYEILTNDEFERGYDVYLEIKEIGIVNIKGIVLNHKLLETNTFFNKVSLDEDNKVEKVILDKYFPIHTKKIINFNPPKPDTRPDGIVFEINGNAYFYEVKFELIN